MIRCAMNPWGSGWWQVTFRAKAALNDYAPRVCDVLRLWTSRSTRDLTALGCHAPHAACKPHLPREPPQRELRLGLEKNPLIQCARRIGEQDDVLQAGMYMLISSLI